MRHLVYSYVNIVSIGGIHAMMFSASVDIILYLRESLNKTIRCNKLVLLWLFCAIFPMLAPYVIIFLVLLCT